MDTQVKSRKYAGDYGYVISAKKYNLKYALTYLGACIVVYLIGLMFFDELAPFFTIASVLLILPSAQFLAKYLSYSKYKTLSQEEFKKLDLISEDFLVLGELPIIRGKKVYKTLATVITKVGVFSYIEAHRDLNQSRKERLDAQDALNSIIKPRNIGIQAEVYDDFDLMCEHLITKVKSSASRPDEQKLGQIAKLYISKTH